MLTSLSLQGVRKKSGGNTDAYTGTYTDSGKGSGQFESGEAAFGRTAKKVGFVRFGLSRFHKFISVSY